MMSEVENKQKKRKNSYPRLKEKYLKQILPSLSGKSYKNVMEVPRPYKVIINMGVGEATRDAKILDHAMQDMRSIAGQQPIITKAKNAISNFKLRQGQAIGCKVTLRGNRMYEFLDRFINMALPRVRDFRGLSRKSFDGNGNYSVGIKEQIVFHEIDHDKVNRIMGMDVTICTSANTDAPEEFL